MASFEGKVSGFASEFVKAHSNQMGKDGVTMDPDKLRAGPGWVLLRRLRPVEEKSVGGIVLSTTEDNNPSLIAQGEVIDSGIYKDKRTGRMSFKAGWLPKGSIVQFIPHNPWSAIGVGSRDIVGAYSDDIMIIPPEAKLEPLDEDDPSFAVEIDRNRNTIARR